MGSLDEVQCLEGHTDRVWQVAWSPSGTPVPWCRRRGSTGMQPSSTMLGEDRECVHVR